MNPPNQILCPKCGSNQLTAHKKGFSGKKAVAGAILTGGIGLLAGTIGSNKIIITCLNCGHQFKPGERPKAQSSTEASPVAGLIVLIIIVGFIILIVKGCGGTNDNSNSSSALKIDTNNKTADTSQINTSHAITSQPIIHKPHIKYEIISKEKDDEGYTSSMFVYTKSMDSLKKLNAFLLNLYKSNHAVTFQIYYFDSRSVAKNYPNILQDQSLSDDEVDRLCQHIIGKYEYNQPESIDDLKIGRDAENL